MAKVIRYLVISALAAILITGACFFVGEFVLASIPGGHGANGSADVYGFPIPYATFFLCCSDTGGAGYSVSLDNTYFYHPLSFAADFAIWFAIAVTVTSMFTIKRLLLSASAGLGATLLTLLASPLSIVAPTPALEATLRPMGFPYEYLTQYVTSFGRISSSGYEFAISAALADFALWTGIAFAAVGVALTILRRAQYLQPVRPKVAAVKTL